MLMQVKIVLLMGVLAYIDIDVHTRDASQAAHMRRRDEESRRMNSAPMTAS